jgi:hypothetical protein
MGTTLCDLRLAVRGLRRSPLFASIEIIGVVADSVYAGASQPGFEWHTYFRTGPNPRPPAGASAF